MNWAAISFDWNQVRAFLATAEEGSFSAAARALKTTQPTIGRQVSGLEEGLGVTLFERSVRGPRLTDAGHDLLDHVRAMGEAATLVSMAATTHAEEVSGLVAVTATDLMSAQVLPGLLAPLRESSPGVRVNVIASNDVQNILLREADIAIRHVRPDQPELIARHVGDFRAGLYASKAYVAREGMPQTPRDVADHDFVGNPDPERLIAPMHDIGIPLRPENFVMASDSGVVVWKLACAGLGITVLPEALCDPEPTLERVLPDLPPFQFPIWLVTHRELQTSRRIRIVFDQLVRGFREMDKLVRA
ncbi:MAG: LysR family transcriptional regulator [Boseongicola sp. SB0664_bin_43]|uniref:LysR family transcriptional regulator n=1 Tax=Boseongicola sp. SB0664_bin_43 TaxID=2604844 RepID=A0A6B0Y1C8_9RHOB|nr:LysR family transcriptional regulator [Boseongicola sp. SB0664_bin_43]MYK30323.1 LysR family transcriptional regulator [Boseongicola sp. SB0670_bin_30]